MARDPVFKGGGKVPGTESPSPSATGGSTGDQPHDSALRPRCFADVIGQKAVINRLSIAVNACKKLKEPLPHILLDGPPGLGKTTFANVLPHELGTTLQITSGPALTRPADLIPFLTNAEEGSILFIDEIHRLPRTVEEFIYPAMEDFRLDIVLGEGLGARTVSMRLKRFTLIGATTRSGMLSNPMRDRFKMHEHLDFYSEEDLATIVSANARKLETVLDKTAALEIAKRSRGTPRIANSRLWWARQYSASEMDGRITLEAAKKALDIAEVDEQGLDKQDRRYLHTLCGVFMGGPTGVEAIAATMNIPTDTLADEIEPYMLREKFIIRTPRGRVATARGWAVTGSAPPVPPPADSGEADLFGNHGGTGMP